MNIRYYLSAAFWGWMIGMYATPNSILTVAALIGLAAVAIRLVVHYLDFRAQERPYLTREYLAHVAQPQEAQSHSD